ncbi:MAG: PHB depolymerase family esterase [Planctomycetota bacterium]
MRLLAPISSLVTALFLAGTALGADPGEGRIVVQAKAHSSHYVLQPPKGYEKGKKWPLIVALHGMGGEAENYIGCWAQAASEAGYFVAAPCGDAETPCRCGQCDDMVKTWSLKSEKFILWVVEDIGKRYSIDEDAVFLNGFSAGAQLALYLAVRNPWTFAGTLPMAGGMIRGIGPVKLKTARNLPIYLVAGTQDPAHGMIVAVGERLKELEFKDVTVLEIPGLGHTVPLDRVPDFLRWFAKKAALRHKSTQAAQKQLKTAVEAYGAGKYGDAARLLNELLEKGAKPKTCEAAKALVDASEAAGEQSLWEAKEMLLSGNRAKAIEALRHIARNFAGMKCANEAADELKNLEMKSPAENENEDSEF